MRADGMPSTIRLKSNATRVDERKAGAALKPGHMLMINSSGELVVHATANDKATLILAEEDALQGKTIDDAYASGDPVTHFFPLPGDEVLLLLAAGAGGDVAIGAYLKSAGDGTVIGGGTAANAVAIANQAVDNDPGSGGAAVFIKAVSR